jgi:hypothetical protein
MDDAMAEHPNTTLTRELITAFTSGGLLTGPQLAAQSGAAAAVCVLPACPNPSDSVQASAASGHMVEDAAHTARCISQAAPSD